MSGNLSIFTRLITRTEVKHFSSMFGSVKKVCSVVASIVLQYLSRALARGCKTMLWILKFYLNFLSLR